MTIAAPRLANRKIGNILLPELEEPRARKVDTRSPFRSTGKYPNCRMERPMQYESESVQKRNAFRLLGSDSTVIGSSEQPCINHVSPWLYFERERHLLHKLDSMTYIYVRDCERIGRSEDCVNKLLIPRTTTRYSLRVTQIFSVFHSISHNNETYVP